MLKITSEILTSRKNPKVTLFASLSDKKARDAGGLFMAEGEKLLWEAISAGLPICYILLTERSRERILPLLTAKSTEKALQNAEVLFLSEPCFEKISTEKAPQGVITIVKHLDFFKKCTIINKNDLLSLENDRLVILASMQDPGNLGAVVRSALAFGGDSVIVGSDSADPYHPRALRAAMGSLFRVKLFTVSDLVGTVKALRDAGRRVYAAELTDSAVPLSEISLDPRDVFVIGNEGHGIPRELSAVCDASVYIPINKSSESLNASVAAAILLWEQQK